jgi:TonB family protein
MSSSRIIKKVLKNGFWLSLLIHLLLLLALLTLVTAPKKQQDQSQPLTHDYVPAYTYTGSIKPSPSRQHAENAQKSASSPESPNAKIADTTPSEPAENIQTTENTQSTLQLPKIPKKMPERNPAKNPIQKSLLTASFDMLKDEQMREVTQKGEAEPIYMIGDDTMPADPLIKLLGRSLSAHFRYPAEAGRFGITGRVILKFTLNPEGHYSNLQMVESSNNEYLDAAAMYAVNTAPKIEGADRFLSKPKTFVVGFLFR